MEEPAEKGAAAALEEGTTTTDVAADGDGAVERATDEGATTGKAEVKTWVLEAET